MVRADKEYRKMKGLTAVNSNLKCENYEIYFIELYYLYKSRRLVRNLSLGPHRMHQCVRHQDPSYFLSQMKQWKTNAEAERSKERDKTII